MADILIKELNSRLAEKIANTVPSSGGGANGPSGVSAFDQVLNTKRDQGMLEKMSDVVGQESFQSNNLQVMPANNIEVRINNGEYGSVAGGERNSVQGLFSAINNDALKMDGIIEVLSSSETKVSRRQLLAYQASIGSLGLQVEMFTKMAQSLSQNLNTLLQTNMG